MNDWPKYDRPFFFHVNTDLLAFKEITVCAKPKEPGSEYFAVGVACCSKGDSYNKKLGNRIARGRATVRSNISVKAKSPTELKNVVDSLAHDIDEKQHWLYKDKNCACGSCSH